MLRKTIPDGPPWDAIWWPPEVHLVLFVHRVDGLHPGIYALVRDRGAVGALRAAFREEFLWEAVTGEPSLLLLLPIDCRRIAQRLACDQDIAADGFFSIGMIARFEPALRERGEWFYRNLFWETGLIGQVLYLAAEAAGARATGIGCYYDDPVHDVLGITGREWQCLYEFSAGIPVEDTRLTTEPGYAWET
jgi:nitroreductase